MEDRLDISQLTVQELESLAYRLFEQQTNVNQNLAIVQQELAKKRNPKDDTDNSNTSDSTVVVSEDEKAKQKSPKVKED